MRPFLPTEQGESDHGHQFGTKCANFVPGSSPHNTDNEPAGHTAVVTLREQRRLAAQATWHAVPAGPSRQITPSRIVEMKDEDGCTVARHPSGCGPSIAGGDPSPQAACPPGAGRAGSDRLRCDNNRIALACQPSGWPTLQANRCQRIEKRKGHRLTCA